MTFVFKPRVLVNALRERGYDAFAEDGVVQGRLDRGAVRQVWIDRGGTLRFQVSRLAEEGRTARVTEEGRRFRVSHEQHAVVNVWADLASVAELPTVLDTVERLARPTYAVTPPDPLPPIYEASTDNAPPTAAEGRMDDTPATAKSDQASVPTDELVDWLTKKIQG